MRSFERGASRRAFSALGRAFGAAPPIPSLLAKNLNGLLREDAPKNLDALGSAFERLERDEELRRTEEGPPPVYGPEYALVSAAFRTTQSYGVNVRVLEDLMHVPMTPSPAEAWEASGLDPDASYSLDFAPENMLDFGAGSSPSVWAARTVFADSLTEATVVEPSIAMKDVAKRLHERSDVDDDDDVGDAFAGLNWSRSLPELCSRVEVHDELPQYDLVCSSYALREVPTESARLAALAYLWELTAENGVLVIIEDQIDWEIVRRAREDVLEGRARLPLPSLSATQKAETWTAEVLAPCTHSVACPYSDPDNLSAFTDAEDEGGNFSSKQKKKKKSKLAKRSSCRFSQKTNRFVAPLKPTASGIGSSEQLDFFSYVAIRKTSANLADKKQTTDGLNRRLQDPNGTEGDSYLPPLWTRIVRPPGKAGGHVNLSVCVPPLEDFIATVDAGDDVDEGILGLDAYASHQGVVVTKKTSPREVYRSARKTKQGRLWPL